MSHQQMFGAIQSQQPFQPNLSLLEEKYPLIEKQGLGRDGGGIGNGCSRFVSIWFSLDFDVSLQGP